MELTITLGPLSIFALGGVFGAIGAIIGIGMLARYYGRKGSSHGTQN